MRLVLRVVLPVSLQACAALELSHCRAWRLFPTPVTAW
jgi:hypothetical protein